MRRQGQITLREVAARARVSKMTASRVFNRPELVDPATQKRVIEAAQSLNYIPDLMAASLTTRRTNTIGAIVSTVADETFGGTLTALSTAIEADGYQLVIASSEYSPSAELSRVKGLLGRRVDGLVLSSGNHSPETIAMLQSLRIPVVETWDMPDRPIQHVTGFSNEGAGRLVADYFIGKGFQRLFFVGTAFDRDVARWNGFNAGCSERMEEPPIRLVGDEEGEFSGIAAGARIINAAIASGPLPCALFIADEMCAIGVVAAAVRAGFSVPTDIAICGFGNLDVGAYTNPTLTTVDVRRQKMGQLAGELLLRSLGGEPIKPTTIDVGFEIVERESA